MERNRVQFQRKKMLPRLKMGERIKEKLCKMFEFHCTIAFGMPSAVEI